MAEIRKIPVDKVLEKMRRDDALRSKRTPSRQEADALNEEVQRLRAARARLNQKKSTDR